MQKKIKPRRDNANLFYGIYSILEKEFSGNFNPDDLLSAVDDFIKVYDGSVTKKIIKDPQQHSNYFNRDTYSVLNYFPFSVCRDTFLDDWSDGFNDYRVQYKLNKLLNN